ncbi:class I SAM-dependent methyltransferase [Piscinibacter terrae]|nr:class I SAM-dependent methyltransferase [Albitalea terrae]
MTNDTGARLRAEYVGDGGSHAVFSRKVAAYVASRPDYPAALFDALEAFGVLGRSTVVADIGAGTGLLTQALLLRAATVTAIEPSDEMRAACDEALRAQAGYRSLNGTAEHTGLTDGCVDLITAAQAFHWFDVDAARREFLRVLTPGGLVALVWNDRVRTDPLHVAMDEVFATYGGAKRGAMLAHEDRSDVPRFFAGAAVREIDLPHEHLLDQAGLRALAFSRSYMPQSDSDAGQAAERDIDGIFERFQQRAQVNVRYRTVAFVGRPGAG